MSSVKQFYVIKLDITNDNTYTYWRLWCNEQQINEIVASRQREYGFSKVAFYEGTDEDIALAETHFIDEQGSVWGKTHLKLKN